MRYRLVSNSHHLFNCVGHRGTSFLNVIAQVVPAGGLKSNSETPQSGGFTIWVEDFCERDEDQLVMSRIRRMKKSTWR